MIKADLLPTALIDADERPAIPIVDNGPTLRFRSLCTGWRLLWLILGLVYLKITGRLNAALTGRRLGRFCQEMGVFWIKVGQLLSMRSDLFPRELCFELARLQDRAEGFPPETVEAIIRQEFGCPVEDVFSRFDPAPWAAASIAQVHRGRLRRGKAEVAIKVRRPGVERVFARDLAVIQRLFKVLIHFSILPSMRWADMLWELEQVFAEELDYRYEVSNQQRLRRTLARQSVYVPEIYGDYCTRNIIVMEFLEATSMADYLYVWEKDPARVLSWSKRNGIEPRRLARRLLHSYLRQVLEDNLFHADLHPGNIFLLRENRFALLDFGSVGFNEGDMLRKYDAFLEALSLGQYAKAIDVFLLIMPDLPDTGLVPVKEDLQRSLHAWGERCRVRELPYKEKSASFIFDEMSRIMTRHGVSISWAFFKVLRGWATMDASLRELNPEANLLQLKRSYIRKRRERELKRVLVEMPSTLLRLQNLVDYPREFLELAEYRGAMVRRLARVFEGTTTRIARLVAAGFALGAVVNAVWVALLGLLMIQQNTGLLPLVSAPALRRLALEVPRLDTQVWLLLMVAFAYFTVVLASLAGRFRQEN